MGQDSGTAPATDHTRALAEAMCGLSLADLSDADVTQLKRLVLDHLGVALRGASLPWSQSLQDYARHYDGTGPCVIIGSPMRTTAPVAALVNGTAAHGLEMDDTHDESLSHPGCVVIATALATGAAQGRTGAEVIAAIAAGYEVMARAGMATGASETVHKGFHSTALYGCFGATTAAGLLLGQDAQTLCRSWGLVLSMAGGSKQFAHDPQGTTVKRLHGGIPAHSGTLAAEFASRGIDGPDGALDGTYGLGNLFGDKPDPVKLVRTAEEPLQIHRISFKPYPCCRLFHSTIDALGEVTDDFATSPDDIRAIRVGAPEVMLTQHMMRRPDSVMAAQYALPFALATSLLSDRHAFESYTDAHWRDPAILDLSDRVDAEQDPEIEQHFPSHFGSWVEVTLKNGEKRRSTVLDSYGTPDRPMPRDAIERKFRTLAAVDHPGFDCDAVFRAVDGLPEAADTTALMAQFDQP